MTAKEYFELPIGDPKVKEIGEKYKLKDDSIKLQDLKRGDQVWYFEVIKVTENSHESILVHDLIEG